MTKATKETVHEEVVTYVPKTQVTLTMTEEEAHVLTAVVGSVLGSRDGTRGITDRIYKALRKVVLIDEAGAYSGKIRGRIEFED
jgi:hypothetical protein